MTTFLDPTGRRTAQRGRPGARSVVRRMRAAAARAAELAATPLVPADYLDLFDPLRRGAELRARVVEVVAETADAATLVLQPGKDWAGHVPGQYTRIGVDVDGVRHWRAYSLTHGPRPDGHISVTVKAVPGGTVSPFLVHGVRPGTLVHLEQAAGEFVLPDAPTRLLFVTAGSGITPVIGMLRNLFPVTDDGALALPRSAGYDIAVVHVAPSRPDSIFVRDLEQLAAAGLVRLVARYDDQHGVLDVDDLEELVPDLASRTTFACGPAALLEALEKHHAERGLTLQTEHFRPANLVLGEGGPVTFARTGTTVPTSGARPLLVEAEDAGVLMPSGCRMGICYGCVLPLRSGSVRDLRTGDLTTATPGETGPGGVPIQTCINAAAGSCEIDH